MERYLKFINWKTWEDININMAEIYRFSKIPYQNPYNIISRNRKFYPKIYMEFQKIFQIKIILKK